MTNPIEAREQAKQAIISYAASLNLKGYNRRCIQDSIMSVALDVAIMAEKQIKE